MTEQKWDMEKAMPFFEKRFNDPNIKKKKKALFGSNPNAMCCLGHMCHALGLERDIESKHRKSVYKGSGSHFKLPIKLARELDITQNGDFMVPVKLRTRYYDSLSLLNDCSTLTPKRIFEIFKEQVNKGNMVRCDW